MKPTPASPSHFTFLTVFTSDVTDQCQPTQLYCRVADGLGRRSTTLNAVTSCTTIMLVSALGKDAPLEDEIYGRLFAVRFVCFSEDEIYGRMFAVRFVCFSEDEIYGRMFAVRFVCLLVRRRSLRPNVCSKICLSFGRKTKSTAGRLQ